jgi:hypothetical protein
VLKSPNQNNIITNAANNRKMVYLFQMHGELLTPWMHHQSNVNKAPLSKNIVLRKKSKFSHERGIEEPAPKPA